MRPRAFTRRIGLCALAACAVLAVATPLAAGAEGGGANNVVFASATADGSSVDRSALQVSQVGGPTVASSNIAAARSYACTGCQTVAIAFQAVLVSGNPDTVVPANAATATNAGCNSCTSYAFAYQYVLSTGRAVYLSPTAQATMAGLRAEAAGLAASGLPPDQLTEELDALAATFKATIDNELIAAGQPVNGASTVRVESAPAS
jgi:putative peptide zinc metalloprotease protein